MRAVILDKVFDCRPEGLFSTPRNKTDAAAYPLGITTEQTIDSNGRAANQQRDPFPISPTGAEIPYDCRDRSAPRACQKTDCQRLAVSLTAWSHATSVTGAFACDCL